MPNSQKPVVCICGSRTIKNLNLDLFIDCAKIGCIVAGGVSGPDTIAEYWAKIHNIEFVYYPARWDIYGKRAGFVRNEEMVNFCDIVIAFWDGKSKGTLHSIQYAQSLGRPYICHLVKELD